MGCVPLPWWTSCKMSGLTEPIDNFRLNDGSDNFDQFVQDDDLDLSTMQMHGFTAAQLAGVEKTGPVDLKCYFCKHIAHDPIFTACDVLTCTNCFNEMSIWKPHLDTCYYCKERAGANQDWFHTEVDAAANAYALKTAKEKIVAEYLNTPVIRSRFDCTYDILNRNNNPEEIYKLFKLIFWFHHHLKTNRKSLMQSYAHSFVRLATLKKKRKIMDDINEAHLLEKDLSVLNEGVCQWTAGMFGSLKRHFLQKPHSNIHERSQPSSANMADPYESNTAKRPKLDRSESLGIEEKYEGEMPEFRSDSACSDFVMQAWEMVSSIGNMRRPLTEKQKEMPPDEYEADAMEFCSSFIEDRMQKLLTLQEKECLEYFKVLKHSPSDEQRERDAFEVFGEYLDTSSRFMEIEKLSDFNYKAGNCVTCIDICPVNNYVAVGGVAKKVRIYDYDDVHYGTKYKFPDSLVSIDLPSKISGVAFAPSGSSQLVISEYDGITSLYDINSCAPIRRHKDHMRRIWDVDFCPLQPKRYATCGDDGKAYMYSVSHEAPTHVYDFTFSATSIRFNPYNSYEFAVGLADMSVRLYDIRFPASAHSMLKGHTHSVSNVRFLSDDKIVSSAIDSSIIMWDKGEKVAERTFRGHKNEKNFVGLITAGDHFVTGSEGGELVMYSKNFSEPLARKKVEMYELQYSIQGRTVKNPLDDAHDRIDYVSALRMKPNSNIVIAGTSQGLLSCYKLT